MDGKEETNKSINSTNHALQWHKVLGDSHEDRFLSRIKMYPELPQLSSSIIQAIYCHLCSVLKSRKMPVFNSARIMVDHVALIHIDILGPTRVSFIEQNHYVLGIIDECTAKSEASFMHSRAKVFDSLLQYIAREKQKAGFKVQSIRLDGLKEHKTDLIKGLKRFYGI